MTKDPAFPFYASDWLGSTKRAVMTAAQRGAYIDLLCHQWGDKTCSLEDDDQLLAALSGLNEGWFNGASQLLRKCFPPHPELVGRIANPRLLELRVERDHWVEKSREGGRKSGVARRKQRRKGGSTTAPTKGQPIGNTPSPSPSSKKPPYSPPFLKLWEAVRKHADHKAKSKGPAQKAYDKAVARLKGIQDDPHAYLLERATAYYSSPEGQTKYANMPSAWLNQARYEDDDAAWERRETDDSSKGHLTNVPVVNPPKGPPR